MVVSSCSGSVELISPKVYGNQKYEKATITPRSEKVSLTNYKRKYAYHNFMFKKEIKKGLNRPNGNVIDFFSQTEKRGSEEISEEPIDIFDPVRKTTSNSLEVLSQCNTQGEIFEKILGSQSIAIDPVEQNNNFDSAKIEKDNLVLSKQKARIKNLSQETNNSSSSKLMGSEANESSNESKKASKAPDDNKNQNKKGKNSKIKRSNAFRKKEENQNRTEYICGVCFFAIFDETKSVPREEFLQKMRETKVVNSKRCREHWNTVTHNSACRNHMQSGKISQKNAKDIRNVEKNLPLSSKDPENDCLMRLKNRGPS